MVEVYAPERLAPLTGRTVFFFLVAGQALDRAFKIVQGSLNS